MPHPWGVCYWESGTNETSDFNITAYPLFQNAENGTDNIFTVSITNNGTMPGIQVNLSYVNIDNADSVSLNQSTLTGLGAGETRNVTLTVRDSTPGLYNVNVTAIEGMGMPFRVVTVQANFT